MSWTKKTIYALALAFLLVPASAYAQLPVQKHFQHYIDFRLLYGVQGQWADYITEGWEHKDKIKEAYFTMEFIFYVKFKKEFKDQAKELVQLIEKSYRETMSQMASLDPYDYHYPIPRWIIITVRFG